MKKLWLCSTWSLIWLIRILAIPSKALDSFPMVAMASRSLAISFSCCAMGLLGRFTCRRRLASCWSGRGGRRKGRHILSAQFFIYFFIIFVRLYFDGGGFYCLFK